MTRPHLWIRAEARPTEQRVPIVPADAARLVADGFTVTVEESRSRIIPLAEYVAVGCAVAAAGSWVDAPVGAVVVGSGAGADDVGAGAGAGAVVGAAVVGSAVVGCGAEPSEPSAPTITWTGVSKRWRWPEPGTTRSTWPGATAEAGSSTRSTENPRSRRTAAAVSKELPTRPSGTVPVPVETRRVTAVPGARSPVGATPTTVPSAWASSQGPSRTVRPRASRAGRTSETGRPT